MATATATQKPAAKKGTPVTRRPFVAGTREVDRAYYDTTVALTAATQQLPVFDVPASGFVAGIYILVEATTAANVAVVTYGANGPFSVIDTIRLNDVQNQPIIGPIDGWDLYVINKYGGYGNRNDPKLYSEYFALTRAVAGLGGSFAFTLRLPIEIARRDAVGSLPNKNNAATFKVDLTLAADATVYGVLPTANPNVRVRYQMYGYDDPSATDMKGNAVSQNPPGVNTTQYWQKQSYVMNAGAFNMRLQGLDSLIRGMVFTYVDSVGGRATGETVFPDPLTIKYEGKEVVNRLRTVWRQMTCETYDLGRAHGGVMTAVVANETAGGRDNGVYPWMFHRDFTPAPGGETRLGYLPVSSATSIELSGTIGGAAAGTLFVLVNKIIPAGGNPMVITGR